MQPISLRRLILFTAVVLLLPSCSDTADDSTDTTLAPTTTTTTAPTTTTTTDGVDPVALRLTFNGESCTYEGATELTPGPFELTFLNESEIPAAVDWARVEEGHTIQDVIDDIGPEPGTEEAPSWLSPLGTWRPVAPGTSYVWEEDLRVGLYSMVCGHYSVTWPFAIWFGTGLTVES
jgi:hypothetical protein